MELRVVVRLLIGPRDETLPALAVPTVQKPTILELIYTEYDIDIIYPTPKYSRPEVSAVLNLEMEQEHSQYTQYVRTPELVQVRGLFPGTGSMLRQ